MFVTFFSKRRQLCLKRYPYFHKDKRRPTKYIKRTEWELQFPIESHKNHAAPGDLSLMAAYLWEAGKDISCPPHWTPSRFLHLRTKRTRGAKQIRSMKILRLIGWFFHWSPLADKAGDGVRPGQRHCNSCFQHGQPLRTHYLHVKIVPTTFQAHLALHIVTKCKQTTHLFGLFCTSFVFRFN
jgi:hypothetical protein